MTHDQHLTDQLFAGHGEMAKLMRSYDWSQTSLGPVAEWPQSLKTSVRIVLTSRQPMFVWWGDDLINLYNDAYTSIVGGKHPEALGQPASVVWREIWDQISPRAESAILKNEGTYDEALLLIMERNGYPEETYYTFSYSPVPNDQGGTGGIICANTDDTQRMINERQLTLLRELAAKTADARTFDEAGTLSARCLGSNPYDIPFAMIYLVDPDQQQLVLAGTAGIDRTHPAVPESLALDAESTWSFAEVLRTHHACLISDLGSEFSGLPAGAWEQSPHQAIIMPIASPGQDGEAGILVAGLNPFRLFDQNYSGFIDLVTAQIAASIANAQAYEAERKRAEALAEIDRTKTAFFSNVSHEFRTPLTLMLSPLEDLAHTLDERLQPDEREQLQLIQRNGLRLQKLVNTLLDFSRIEAGRVQASYEPIDLAAYTAELASVFRSLVERAGMNLVIDCPPLPERVYVDREMWEKIVLNLLSNAFKFTFAGSITVRLYAVGHQVELSVADTGVGIPAAELPRLFERFHRVNGARSRTYEGSGIGLALVQELVKLHGGTIQVSSQLDQGTTFTITLPAGISHLPPDRIGVDRTLASTSLGAVPYVEEASRWLSSEGSGEWNDGQRDLVSLTADPPNPTAFVAHLPASPARILLADDNADMRDYVKRLLSQLWYVETVSNGVEALAAIAQRPPDLVLSDVMMPALDGFGLLHELRANPQTKEIPIVLLSARAGEEARIEGLEAGADDYLTKPFSARELLARIESNLKLAQLRKTAARQEQSLRLEVQVAKDNLENVLTRIADQFLAFDQDWRYTYVNDRVVEITGISRENLLGRSIWDVFPDVMNSQFETEMRRAVAEQTPVQFEYFYPQWGRWFENHVYPAPDGVSVIVTDITDRKRAEAALQESEERLRVAQLAAKIGAWDWDLTHGHVFWSDEYYTLYGLDPTITPTYENWLASVFEADRATVEQTMRDTFQQQRSNLDFEFRTFHPTQGIRWFGCIGQIFYNSAGQPTRAIGIAIDITDRKQAETALYQSEERYRYLAEMIPQLVWTADVNGTLIDINQRWSDFTGLTLAEAQIHGWGAVVHPDDIPTLSQNWAAAQQGVHYRAEGRMRRADGAYRWHLHEAVPFKNEHGQVIKWFGTATDIEAQKQLEYQRQHLLEQEQAAREQAETANRIKDEFLAVLSHELRSPLNPILGWAKLLRTGRLDATKTAQAIETIERNAKLQTQLVEDLLDVSRILQGKLHLQMASVKLVPTIEAALETVRLAAEAKSIHIQATLDQSTGAVLGDATRLQQVIWNLLTNAIKFTPNGGQVDICLKPVEAAVWELAPSATPNGSSPLMSPPPMYAQIQVSDTGKGIHPSFLPYVFEYFRQEDGKTTRSFGGLGLGLAIVRHLVELHGGTVQAESSGEQQGATFTVRLPLLEKRELRVGKRGDNSAAPHPTPEALLAGLQILLVDDSADTRDLVAFTLEQHGAIVTACASAPDALTTLMQTRFNILISDIGMPGMDGYALVRQIRALPPEQGGTIFAIALTAYAGEFDHQRAIAAGFQKHLPKPIEPQELVNTICEAGTAKRH